jgi:oxygen-independent coproporphyrinogen-3 oxidase
MSGEEVGLYVHIPFCRRKCDYCDFCSMEETGGMREAYLKALEEEIVKWSEALHSRSLHSIYFGGGTPSLLSAANIKRLLRAIRDHYSLSENIEITLEANPETLNAVRLASLFNTGINRLSIGLQSFQPLLLRRLGRLHSPRRNREAGLWARKSGFENLSLDLIYGIPGQSLEAWRLDLENAVRMKPDHLSVYELTLEPHTHMARRIEAGVERQPEEETVISMYELAEDYLTRQGFQHYEISNFCMPGRACVHNLAVWHRGEYLGVGLGAHSHLDGRRFHNTTHLETYLQANQEDSGEYRVICEQKNLDGEQKWSEALFLGLRLVDGVELKRLEKGIQCRIPDRIESVLNRFTHLGLVERLEDRVRLTNRGRLLSNCVFSELTC